MPDRIQLPRSTPLDFPLLVFFLSVLLGTLPAYDRASTTAPLLWLAGCLCFYFLVSRLGRLHGAAAWIARCVTVTAAVAAAFFVTQAGRYDTLEKIGPLVRLSQSIARFFPALNFWTPVSNSMAALLEGLLFLAVGCFLAEKNHRWRVIIGISAVLMALALLFSQSRGAWLALACAGLLWLACYWRPARWLAVAGGLLLLVLVIFVLVQGDLQALERVPVVNRTLAPIFIRPDRLAVYRGSIYLLQDVPFTGIGLGQQFAMNYSRYVLLIQVPFLTYSHNFYLETWLQTGLLGLGAWIWLAAALIYCAIYLRRSEAGVLAQSAVIGMAAIMIHGVTDARQYIDLWCWLPVFLLAGFISAAWLRREPAARQGWLPAAAAGLFVLAFILGAGPLPAAWQSNSGSLEQARAELSSPWDPNELAAGINRARAFFEDALEKNPGQRTANLRLGLIETGAEQFGQAVAHLEAAHRADPANPTAIKALGLAYTWNGNIEQAAKMLAAVGDMDQELNTWAFWRAGRGQTELSRYAYQVSLLLNPAQPQVEEALRQLDLP